MPTRRKKSRREDPPPSRRRRKTRKPAAFRRRVESDQRRQMPPVMVRAGSYTDAGKLRKKSRQPKVKRRYDIALKTTGSQGVEMRLPSVPIVRPGWRILSFIITAGMISILYFMWNSPIFTVQSLDIQGLLRLSPAEVTRELGILNKPIFTLAPAELEASLAETYPALTEISVQVGYPSEVLVQVNERVPMIAWVEDTETLWIDGNGFVFTPFGEADNLVSVYSSYDPPQLDLGQSIEEGINSEVEQIASIPKPYVEAIFVLKTQAPEGTKLVYQAKHGFGWSDPRGWQVYFGNDLEDIDEKLLVYRAVVQELKSKNIIPELISVEYVHAPYYR